jgi:hypothetical protein
MFIFLLGATACGDNSMNYYSPPKGEANHPLHKTFNPADRLVVDEVASIVQFHAEDYEFQGHQLMLRQIERGLEKKLKRSRPRDQSFEGLRDIINDSQDDRFKTLLPVVHSLEKAIEERQGSPSNEYIKGFVREMAPAAIYIQEHTGLPASIMVAQMIVESGWGGSNITILKNNLLGIGNSKSKKRFTITVTLGDESGKVDVYAPADTSAFWFGSLGDCLLYYVYVLLQSPDNATHYQKLRDFINNNRKLWDEDRDHYRDRILFLIAESYHEDPDWYVSYLRPLVKKLIPIEDYKTIIIKSEP